MFRPVKFFAWLSLAAVLALAACSAATPTPNSNTVYTQAAGTVAAELTQSVYLTPSATATATVADTDTPAAATADTTTPTDTTPVSTTPVLIPTTEDTATLAAVPDRAEFVSQTIADGTTFNGGNTIKMTWTLKNIGTTTWTTAYTARYYAGDQMGAPASVALSTSVAPGAQIDIVVNFVAPSDGGAKRSIWVLQNPDGVNFYNFYLDVKVIAATATSIPPTATKVPAATATQAPTDTQPAATVAPTAAPTVAPTTAPTVAPTK
jgi:hypothetical protein